jgi:hypothetical protein
MKWMIVEKRMACTSETGVRGMDQWLYCWLDWVDRGQGQDSSALPRDEDPNFGIIGGE